MKKSLEKKINSVLRCVLSAELKPETLTEGQVEIRVVKLISEIQQSEYSMDLKNLHRVNAILTSELFNNIELSNQLMHLLTGADERKKYFES